MVNHGPDFDAAAVFTTNRFCAAPVIWSSTAIEDGAIRAVVLNSGGANACTGQPGLDDTRTTAERVAAHLGCDPQDIAVCSTGLIGERLPLDTLLTGVDDASAQLSPEGFDDAAEAIITTDTRAKTASVTSESGYVIAGMAKGAGMLAPSLATMLVTIVTDAIVEGSVLDEALSHACEYTFNRVDSDGCMSTNDTVICLANGASGVEPSSEEFTKVLRTVCADLAAQLLSDAEGSSHDIEIVVTNAASEADALTVARSVARNNLFKCAIFGNDPNWGRILAAIGTTDAIFNPAHVDVAINGVEICHGGGIGEDRTLVDLSRRDCVVRIDLHAGDDEATIWTNDLTYDYVKENAEYSS